MNRDDFAPYPGEETCCLDCGLPTEPDMLDMGHDAGFGERCDCEEAVLSVAVEGIYSPVRDTREHRGDDERFVPEKESA